MSNIDLKKVKTPRQILAVAIATAFGAGFTPKAPGTMGALVALPLAFIAASWDWPLKLALWVGLTIIGTWSAKVIDEIMGSCDNQSIVMDEVIGLGITAWVAGPDWTNLMIAFVLFRFFDIVKLPPVRALDRWSKNKALEPSTIAKWWGGFGVMGDDILAGIQGLLVLMIIQAFRAS